MFGEKHDIPHEFPEFKHLVEDLQNHSAEFKEKYAEYHGLDDEIRQIEQNVETTSDFYAEELKKKRVHLKDELYTMLREFSEQEEVA